METVATNIIFIFPKRQQLYSERLRQIGCRLLGVGLLAQRGFISAGTKDRRNREDFEWNSEL
jgi:hypothetical protein